MDWRDRQSTTRLTRVVSEAAIELDNLVDRLVGENEELEAEVEDLKSRLEDAEGRVDALEAALREVGIDPEDVAA